MNQINTAEKGAVKHLSTYGLALFFLLTPFEYPLADLMMTSPLRLVGLFAMGLAVVDIFAQRTVKLDYRILCVTLWLAYGFITLFWAIDENRFRSYYSIYVNNALMFLLFSMISFTKAEVNFLKKSMIFGVGALILYMTFIPGAVVYGRYQDRLTLNTKAGGLDQNYLAALMLISFGLVFYNICNVKQKRNKKILQAMFCIAIAVYIILTGSRSGLIALLLIVLLNINASWKVRLSIGIPVVFLIVVGLPFVAQYLSDDLLERFSLKAITGQSAESSTRLLIWARALSSLKDFRWTIGYGVGASQTVVGNIFGRGDMAVHNHYLAMVVEFGVLGWILINTPIIKMLQFVQKKDQGMAIAFLGILLLAAFIDVVTTKFFWSAMILLSACCNEQGKRLDEKGGRV